MQFAPESRLHANAGRVKLQQALFRHNIVATYYDCNIAAFVILIRRDRLGGAPAVVWPAIRAPPWRSWT